MSAQLHQRYSTSVATFARWLGEAVIRRPKARDEANVTPVSLPHSCQSVLTLPWNQLVARVVLTVHREEVHTDPPSNEHALVAKARKGDAYAYEELVRLHQDVAFRVAYLVLGKREDAEDAIQEAFVKAFHALDRFDTKRPFRPWLLRIATNEARNAQKAAHRRASLLVRYAEAWGQAQSEVSPESRVLDSERREQLLSALDSLKEEERFVISLRFFLELSEQEMSEVLGCRRGTVKSRLSRSMGSLRQVIRARFPQLEAFHEL